jgi:23S rRNA (uracil1939-C5)-methyltransferase
MSPPSCRSRPARAGRSRSLATTPTPEPSPAAPLAVTVRRLGADGDGIAEGPDGSLLYLPRTLPGERVLARPLGRCGAGQLAEAVEILQASPERIPPLCPHFATCGGCALQHWQAAACAAWKAGLLQAALQRAGYVAAIARPVAAPAASRRRFDFAFQRETGGVRLGLHTVHRDTRVAVRACPVLHPVLEALLAPLREVLSALTPGKREGRAVANLLDTGVDLLLTTATAPSAAARARLIAFAHAHGLARISWSDGHASPETLCALAPPRLHLAGVAVSPPPGAFLQATREGEAAIVAAVLGGLPERLPPRASLIELYAGCGTLSFPLAARARLLAYEGNPAQAAALQAASRAAGLDGRLRVVCRDLTRQPLGAEECAADAVVLDPPYDGAARQMQALAAARPPRVIYVSCNPAALARDAAVLHAAGYRLLAATAVDQFVWSARLEAVVVFARA